MKPRVLVVEDDPVSRAFFQDVLAGLPATVDAAACCDAAEACARAHRHVLWLVDAHLPDGDAVSLLPRLRMHGTEAVALAHTASRESALHRALLAAGYAEVLVKPVAVGTLLSTVGRRLRMRVREPRAPFVSPPSPADGVADEATAAPWDDTAALAGLGGDASHVQALRALFVGELAATVAGVDAALHAGDTAATRELLHRLSSGCAFTGASSLGIAVRRLHADPADATAAEAFRHAAARLL
ncbi:MAG TPA: response regulator [Xanthomonadaceae bacterium]|nr:response regulator [Xanthomonadaceae bacterium]